MSLHRFVMPPPVVLAVHPVAPSQPKKPAAKNGEKETDKAKDKAADQAKDAEKPAKSAVKEKKVEHKLVEVNGDKDASAGEAKAGGEVPSPISPTAKQGGGGNKKKKKGGKGGNKGAAVVPGEAPPTPVSPLSPAAPPKGGDGASDKNDKAEKKDGSAIAPAEEPIKPAPPIRLLSPAPPRPPKAKLDLDPNRPYPAVHIDPRGAHNKYAKWMQNEDVLIDVTKDGWLTQQWRSRAELEALEELTGEAARKRQRAEAKALEAAKKRAVPHTAEQLIKELWNDLAETPNKEMKVGRFWSRYDWSDPAAAPHMQKRDEEAKKEDERIKAEKIAKAKAELEAKQLEQEAAKAGKSVPKKDTPGVKKPEDAKDKEAKGAEVGGKEPNADKGAEPKADDSNQTKSDDTKPEAEKAPAADGEEEMPKGYATKSAWTREGVEEVLATIGIQCIYNTKKPVPRDYTTPPAGFLVLSHGHFILRKDADLDFKPEAVGDKFDVLVTSSSDRVFGPMVKAKQAEERKRKEKAYKERKERERREAKAKEAKAAKDGKDEKKGEKAEGDKEKKEVKGEKPEGEAGPADKEDKKAQAEEEKKPDPAAGDNGGTADGKAVEADVKVVAVPVAEEAKNLDEKHEAEPALLNVVVADATAGEKPAVQEKAQAKGDGPDKKADGDKKADAKDANGDKAKAAAARPRAAEKKPERPFDPEKDMSVLVKILGPEVAELPLKDLQAAVAAVEKAAAAGASLGRRGSTSGKGGSSEKKDVGPLIWKWHERVESWRWKAYTVGCARLEPGCWEERDWKAFPDDQYYDAFEAKEQENEAAEVDVHDWGV